MYSLSCTRSHSANSVTFVSLYKEHKVLGTQLVSGLSVQQMKQEQKYFKERNKLSKCQKLSSLIEINFFK